MKMPKRLAFSLVSVLLLVLLVLLQSHRPGTGSAPAVPPVTGAQPASAAAQHSASASPVAVEKTLSPATTQPIHTAKPQPVATALPEVATFAPPTRSLTPAAMPVPPAAPAPADPRFPRSILVSEQRQVLPSGAIRLERLLRTQLKYPLVRVEEEWAKDKASNTETLRSQTTMVADHVMVGAKPGVSEAQMRQVIAKAGGKVRRHLPLSDVYLVAFEQPTLETVSLGIAALQDVAIKKAEPDFIVFAERTPSDTRFGELWGMNNTGQSAGVADADIDATEAWDLTTGSRSVLVGIIDTGLDRTHPDLIDNLWTNPREIANNGIDDDNNGYTDDTVGWDFADEDNNPDDDNDHGTHCAGTIGGVGDNASGVAGVCWQVSMVGLKFLKNGSGTTSDGIEAIAYGTRIGVTLTSNSWGGGGFSQLLKDVIDAADRAGILFVAAAGNSSVDNDSSPHYPSSYTSPNIIAVASSTRTDDMSYFSCFGLRSVDLAAPGSDIISSVRGASYASFSGTSMATPHVSGACALLKAYRPVLTYTEIRDIIFQSVDPVPAFATRTASGGRLNVHQALLSATSLTVSSGGFTAIGQAGGPFAPSSKVYTLTNRTGNPASWTAATGVNWASASPASGTLAPGATATVTVSLTTQSALLADGRYNASLTITNTTAAAVQTRPLSIIVGYRDYFTEAFDSAASNDLSFNTFLFTPNTSRNSYAPYRAPATAFPTDPSNGVPLALTDDNYDTIDVPQGRTVQLYGQRYSAIHVGSNGYLTFTAGSSSYNSTLSTHFSTPRVSAMMSDLVPNSSNVSYKLLMDRIAITFLGVRRYSLTDSNSFQIEMFYDGRIRLTYLAMAAPVFIVGLSDGTGLQDDFFESDFSAYSSSTAALNAPILATEGDGTLSTQGTVTLSPARTTATLVTLTSSNTNEVTLPSQVTIPAGATSVGFDITIVDDSILDGTIPVTLSAHVVGLSPLASVISVQDDETTTLTLAAPANVTEGDTNVNMTLSTSDDLPNGARISLSSSNENKIKLPATADIPAGERSVVVPIIVVDDTLYDSADSATIQASVAGWTTGTATIAVADNEVRALSIVLPNSVSESAGVLTGQVQLGGQFATNVNVQLTSSASPDIAVASSVTIYAGTTGSSFALSIADNASINADRTALITATASSFASASHTLTVQDDDPSSFSFDPIGVQYSAVPFPITIRALNASGSLQANFGGVVDLTGSMGLSSVLLTPSTAAFVNGIARVSVSFPSVGQTAVITARDAVGHAGSSAPFTVRGGSPDYLTELFDYARPFDLAGSSITFSPISSSEYKGTRSSAVSYPSSRVGTTLAMSDDTSVLVTLSAGRSVQLYGVSYTSFHVGSNGYITFNSADTSYNESLSNHFAQPRISVAMDDLYPTTGQVTWSQQTDRVVVTWHGVPLYGESTALNQMQLEMFFDGTVRMTYLNMGSATCLAGLSAGAGVPPSFINSDLSSYTGSALTLTLPATVNEGDGSFTGSVSLGHLGGGTVLLNSARPQEISLPHSVVVPVGQLSADFTGLIADDADLDGSQSITIRASLGSNSTSTPLQVLDNESTTITLEVPANLAEGQSSLGMVTLADAPVRPVQVQLSSSDPSELRVATFITIPAGQLSAPVSIAAISDLTLDGDQNVTLSAQVTGWTPAESLIVITNQDIAALSLSTVSTISEGNGSATVTLALAARHLTNVILTLESSDPSRLSLPSSAIIPAGSLSTQVTALLVDNNGFGPDTSVTLTASANGFNTGTTSVLVLEDDPTSLEFEPITAQTAHRSFLVTIRAISPAGRPLPGFIRPVALTATAGGQPIVISPFITPPFVNGSTTFSLNIPQSANGIVLTATATSGQTGQSNAFNVGFGTRDYYTEVFETTGCDLINKSFTFTPTGPTSYSVDRANIKAYPSDPKGGTDIYLTENGYQRVTLANGAQVKLFGVAYNSFYINANGNITFNYGSDLSAPSAYSHFSQPRVSGLLLAYDVTYGTISYKQHSDHIAVTYFLGIKDSRFANLFQIALYFDGRIRLSYLGVWPTQGVAGLSRGYGVPTDFFSTDFTDYSTLIAITRQPVSAVVNPGKSTTFSVTATGSDLVYQWRKNGVAIPGARKAAFTVASPSNAHEGSYDVALANRIARTESQAATLVVNDPVVITTTPDNYLVPVGAPVQLNVAATGTPPISYQWLKSRKAIAGAQSTQFALTSARLSDGGLYTASVKNITGTVLRQASVAVVQTTSAGAVASNIGRPLILLAPASGEGIGYQWLLNDQPIADTANRTGTATAKLSFRSYGETDAGAYTCVISQGSAQLETGAITVRSRFVPELVSFTPRQWRVGRPVTDSIAATKEPASYAISGLPPGVFLDKVTGQLSGTPTKAGSYNLSITATNLAGTTAPQLVTVTVLPLPAEALGSFEGLIEPGAASSQTIQRGGTLRLSVTPTGSYTGSLLFEGATTALKGNVRTSNTGQVSLLILGQRSPLFTLSADFSPTALIGSLTVSSTSETVAVEARSVGLTAATPLAGQYLGALLPNAPAIGDLAYPQGYGHLMLQVSPTGSLSWTTTLADATLATGSAKLGPSGRIPLHHQLYDRTASGSLHGWLSVGSPSVGGPWLDSLPAQPLLWRKPSQPGTTRSYRSGFGQHSLTLIGQRYIAPGPGEMLLNLDPATMPNAQLTFAEAKLDNAVMAPSGQLTQTRHLAAGNVLQPIAAADNPASILLTLKPSTGTLTGSFTLKNDPNILDPAGPLLTRKANFSAVFVPRLGQALGHFQLHDLPSQSPFIPLTTTPQLSGSVIFEAKP